MVCLVSVESFVALCIGVRLMRDVGSTSLKDSHVKEIDSVCRYLKILNLSKCKMITSFEITQHGMLEQVL